MRTPTAARFLHKGSFARSRRRTVLLVLGLTVPLGLIWRFGPLHLPPFAFKYGGSALWAAGVYWTVALVFPRSRPALVAGVATVIAVSVELFKRVRAPALDHFRATLTGKVLLGRYFTVGALLAYLIAIASVAWLDDLALFRRRS